jgi:hypothetical protein
MYFAILKAEGFSPDEPLRLSLLFEYPPQYTDGYSVDCHAKLDAQTSSYMHSVNHIGETIAHRFETLEPDAGRET